MQTFKRLCMGALYTTSVAVSATLSAQQPAYDRSTKLPPLRTLQRDVETDMARSAAPAAVSDHATIWVATNNGYEIARKGSNGWGCFVQRNAAGTGVFPRCDDPERVATLYPVYFLLEEYRALGRTAADYDRAVAEGYKSGKYRSPAVGAFSYMLADGVIKPHVMFSLPSCKAEHLGLTSPDQLRDSTLSTVLRGLGDHDCEVVIFTPESSRRHHSASKRSG